MAGGGHFDGFVLSNFFFIFYIFCSLLLFNYLCCFFFAHKKYLNIMLNFFYWKLPYDESIYVQEAENVQSIWISGGCD